MVQNESTVNPGFGHLRLIDYLVIFYCIVRIIGETRPKLGNYLQAVYMLPLSV